MVINTNLIGAGGAPVANAAERPGSKARAIGLSKPPGAPASLSSEVNETFAGAGSEIADTEAAGRGTQAARAGILGNPATAMLAQANLSPEMVLGLLQD